MADEHNPEASFDALNTVEHEDLASVVEMVTELERLHQQGLGLDDMAAAMARSGVRAPADLPWSGPLVAKILGVVDSVRAEQPAPAPSAEPPAGPTPVPAPPVPAVPPTSSAPSPPPAPAASIGASPAATAPPSTSASPSTAVAPGPSGERFREPSSLRRLVAPVAVLAGLGAAVAIGFGLLTGDADRSTTEAAPTASEETVATTEATDGEAGTASGADTTGSTTTPSTLVVPAAPEEGDPADMLAIRVEPDQPEVIDPETGEVIPLATATIRADGRLHLEGTFPSEDAAASYVDGLSEVFGRDNIVENYGINPAALLPATDEVALDKPVLFASGTAIIDPSYHDFLEACGDVLKLNPQITMSISAFTDSDGGADFNLELSRQRAQAIVDFYRGIDVPDQQLVALGFGESEPVGDNETAEGRRQNRRAMLRLLDVLATT